MTDLAAWKVAASLGGVVVLGAIVANASFQAPSHNPVAKRSAALGYLAPRELPDSVALLLPPPKLGSEAMRRDEEARKAALGMRSTPRYRLAAADANRAQDSTTAAFQCALGTEISKARTPRLYQLLSRVRLDIRAASYPAKSHFKRPRPFVMYDMPACFASDQQNVRYDGSYPSARGAVGLAYAEVLAALNPARASEIKRRGEEFAQSRVICDEEWLSDVDAAHAVARATMKRIYDKADFRADCEAARREMAAGLKASRAPPNCRSETLALASAKLN